MGPVVGIYGNSSVDEYLLARKVNRTAEQVEIIWGDGSAVSFRIQSEDSKVTLSTIPADFARNVEKRRLGGGGTNSRLAVEAIVQSLRIQEEIRYLDGHNCGGRVDSVPSSTRCLSLRESPINYVVGDRDDKQIFRSPIGAAKPMGAKEMAGIDWLSEARMILVNSAKDPEAVKAIFDRGAQRGSEIIFVLTPSLPVGFLKRTVLPQASVLIAAWDEVRFLTGEVAASIDETAAAVEKLRNMSPAAEIHVTMGKRGVLSCAPGTLELTHVRLAQGAEAANEVSQIANSSPTSLCGAGDAFAGGVLLERALGSSFLSDQAFLPSTVRSALAGCASALRWIGVRSPLTAAAFRILPITASVDPMTLEQSA